jgi:hypothetical protein
VLRIPLTLSPSLPILHFPSLLLSHFLSHVLAKDNPVYEEAYQCSQWPLFVGYTSEPETSAVGASWGVFYGLLGRVLRDDEGETEELRQEMQITDITGTERRKLRTYTEGSTSLHFSSRSPLPSADLTIAEFYSTVTAEYYKVEPFVHHVNFALTQEERTKESYVKFGVLGVAQGVGGQSVVGSITVSSFFD